MELSGILPTMLVMNILFDAYGLEFSNQATLFCDNECTVLIINKILDESQMTDFGDAASDCNLLFELQNEICKTKYTFNLQLILSQQDEKHQKADMSLAAILNCECDVQAKEVALILMLNGNLSILHGKKWGVLQNNYKLNSKLLFFKHELT